MAVTDIITPCFLKLSLVPEVILKIGIRAFFYLDQLEKAEVKLGRPYVCQRMNPMDTLCQLQDYKWADQKTYVFV